jgi:hypothetical protein
VQETTYGGMRWHRSSLRWLVVLPAAGLAAVVFAAPVHAEDQPQSPQPTAAVEVDRSVTIVVDETDATALSDAAAAHAQPPAATTEIADPDVAIEQVETLESPANQEASLWVLAEQTQPSRAASNPQAAVISTSGRAPIVARSRAVKVRARPASRATGKRQYQSPRVQYQHDAEAALSVGQATPWMTECEGTQASGPSPAIGSIGSDSASSNGASNCSNNPDQDTRICPVDADWNVSCNCPWIAACTPAEPPEENLPPELGRDEADESDPSDCDFAARYRAQYQPSDEQYQSDSPSEPEEVNSRDSGDENTTDPADEECADVFQTAQSAMPTASGVQPQGLAGVQPVAPADVAAAVEQEASPTPVAVSPRPRGHAGVRQPAPRPAGKNLRVVLSAAIRVQPRPRLVDRTAATSRPRTSSPPRRRAAPAPRISALALGEPASHDRAAFGAGVRLLAFAMALSALALLALAFTGLLARRDRNLFGLVGSFVKSKGLSRSSTIADRTGGDRADERSSGIRYRD